jgi:hypothetical protein
MGKGIMLALLLGLVLTAIGGAQEKTGDPSQASGGEPTALIENMRHDFGQIYEQKSFKHTFKVKNTGSGDLNIEQVKPG